MSCFEICPLHHQIAWSLHANSCRSISNAINLHRIPWNKYAPVYHSPYIHCPFHSHIHGGCNKHLQISIFVNMCFSRVDNKREIAKAY